jgi:putative oxidoreductase
MAFEILRNGRSARDAALVPMRLALGSTMVYHGASKLRGQGPQQTAQMFEQLGIRPARTWALATGIAETFAGVAAILGVMTRPAAVAVLVTQAVAIARVHGRKGFSVMQGGFEYNLALMAIAAGLLVEGPGRVSAHEAIEHAVEGHGPRRVWRRARPTLLSRAVRLIK